MTGANESIGYTGGLLKLGGIVSIPVAMLMVAVLVTAAAWTDIRSRRIPNRLVFAGAGIGLIWQLTAGGVEGLLAALGGMGVGLAVMVPFYVLRAMGAGDVKLMTMVGAFLGPVGTFSAALLTFVVGGVLAVVIAIANGTLGQLLSNLKTMVWGSLGRVMIGGSAQFVAPVVSVGKLPYGVVIALGTLAYIGMRQAGMDLF